MATPDERWPTASFEEKYTMMMGSLSKEAQKRSVEQLVFMCQCAQCPSYTGTGETDLVFCTLGKSHVIQEQKGCLCPQCGVTKTMSMRWDHYCTKGSAVELSDLPPQE
ncbi:MAG: DUF2769 domain-containing protein [Promethearchaeota archaeon]